ncbi:RagB/SusD family nutrient uptake outer membrane protein [Pedobacter gandavensis]|uniref:RagB/SusD family nutrient uptake outer membrane protein n=1 Tax=Pedobacter gandavensis TaxID=2679963 RepID=UPI00247B0F2D|nr:RagB/SusD family nutrient uptake outer membrane protein [Pedobacter gandavensis]WGQ11003.1 RagB/SusD family nutrient uptake outer membrane protein [Pedobacter gandavensis]
MRKYTYLILFVEILTLLTFSSCKKYLDVSDDFSESDSKGFIFTNPGQSRRFQRYIYKAMPDYSDYSSASSNANGLGNPWASMSDELKNNANGVLRNIVTQGYTASTAPGNTFHRWATLYKVIRQATIYIDSGRVIGAQGDPDFIDDAELKQLKAEAYFFRAYSHYLLFEQYGPIPIMNTEADPTDPNVDFFRNSVDEVLASIDADLLKAKEDLSENRFSTSFASGFDENKLAIPTKGVALAVRAKLWMYAASPLYNGGYSEALALTNSDGKKLFPAKDPGKWVKAKNAVKDFIDFANAGNYELYYSATANNPHLNIYELFQRYNKEIIWANPIQSFAAVEANQTPRDITVTAGGSTGANLGVTQEMVDAFFTKDGLDIHDAGSQYTEVGFSNVPNPATRFVKSGSTVIMTDANISNMYANREPRFYASVTYQGKSWHDVVSNTALQGTTAATSKATKVLFARGISSSVNPLPGYGGIANNDNRIGGFPSTGYLCYKRSNRTIHPTVGSGIRSVFRPSIIFRLADFYLLYAEALNEINPADPEIITYLDKVRLRAGIPGYLDLQNSGLKTGVIGQYAAQVKAIRQERQIELFTEGQRYFDVRRWMIADKPEGRQGGVFHGMNMDGKADDLSFYQRNDYDRAPRVFSRAMYLYPIPLSQITISKKLIQNPGW